MNLHEQAVDTVEKILVMYEVHYKDKALQYLTSHLYYYLGTNSPPVVKGNAGCCGLAELIGVQNVSLTLLASKEQLAKEQGYSLAMATIPTKWPDTEGTFTCSGWSRLHRWTNVRTGREIGLWVKGLLEWEGRFWQS